MFIESTDFQNIAADLVNAVRDDISDEYRADPEDEEPGIQLTVACDDVGENWTYQTGDNSYMGSCYHLPHWAVISVYRDTVARDAAIDIRDQLLELVQSW